MKTPIKIHRSGQIYEYMKPEEKRMAVKETYVVEDVVTMPDTKTYVTSLQSMGLPKNDVIPVLDASRYKKGMRILTEMREMHNGAFEGIGRIRYKDIIWMNGTKIPVIVLEHPMPHPPRVGAEIFQICGEDENLISERLTDHAEKEIKRTGINPWLSQ